MYAKALITLKNGTKTIFRTDEEDKIADYIYGLIGAKSDEEISGIPTFIEASSWCSLAGIGEVFERDCFCIEIIE